MTHFPGSITNIQLNMPFGHFQFKLVDLFCTVFSPNPNAGLDVLVVGQTLPNSHMLICPEIGRDTITLNNLDYTRQIYVVSGTISTLWTAILFLLKLILVMALLKRIII